MAAEAPEEAWDEESQTAFYARYRHLAPKDQAEALYTQAQVLSQESSDQSLKGAESLLLMWLSKHFDRQEAPKIYHLIAQLCHRMGDQQRADHFHHQLKVLRQGSSDRGNR